MLLFSYSILLSLLQIDYLLIDVCLHFGLDKSTYLILNLYKLTIYFNFSS